MTRIALAAFLGVAAGIAGAKPLTITLPDDTGELRSGPAPGFAAAQNNCLSCHSADYVATQPPKKGKAFWEAEVVKMIAVYHAPIDAADAMAIADYLAEAY